MPACSPVLDALAEERFAPLRPYRVGLITNQTGLDSHNARPSRRVASLLEAGVRLAALFLSPSTTLRRRGPRDIA